MKSTRELNPCRTSSSHTLYVSRRDSGSLPYSLKYRAPRDKIIDSRTKCRSSSSTGGNFLFVKDFL